jgi:hypothetical protein
METLAIKTCITMIKICMGVLQSGGCKSYSYEAEFIQKLQHEKKKSLAVAFNSTF